MNIEKQNQIIADLCPGVFTNVRGGLIHGSGWYFFSKAANEWCRCVSGSIVDDLNACHEIEKGLEISLRGLYWDWLHELIRGTQYVRYLPSFY